MKLKAKSGALKKAMDKLKPKTKKLGTVLIIDDEQANVDGLARFLENDYRVLSTTDPHEAVRIGQEETIDEFPDLLECNGKFDENGNLPDSYNLIKYYL